MKTVDKKFPDTAAGAIAMLREYSTLKMRGATASSDRVVKGCWCVTLPAMEGRQAIAYLAGYRDTDGTVRKFNDFEVEDEPKPRLSKREHANLVRLCSLTANEPRKMCDAVIAMLDAVDVNDVEVLVRRLGLSDA